MQPCCSKNTREPKVKIAPITQLSIPGNWIRIPPSNYKHSSLRDKGNSNWKINVELGLGFILILPLARNALFFCDF